MIFMSNVVNWRMTTDERKTTYPKVEVPNKFIQYLAICWLEVLLKNRVLVKHFYGSCFFFLSFYKWFYMDPARHEIFTYLKNLVLSGDVSEKDTQ